MATKRKATFAVFDTETTGLGPQDQVVEVACAIGEWDGGQLRLVSTFSSLVRPTVPVTPQARANHHLLDEELADAPPPEVVLRNMPNLHLLTGSLRGVAAHNADFDVRMLRQSGFADWLEDLPVVDTIRLAKHAFPSAPAYGNQVLRYYLELAVPGPQGPVHRALFDTLVTFALLERILQETGAEALPEMMGRPPLLQTCQIGKEWKGKPWSAVDVGMLRWILQKDFDADVKYTAQHWLSKKTGRML